VIPIRVPIAEGLGAKRVWIFVYGRKDLSADFGHELVYRITRLFWEI